VAEKQEVVQSQVVETPTQKDTTRCFGCKKKVGLLGFKCRCGFVFCSMHRIAEAHNCTYDYKAANRAKLEEQNPQIVSSKLQKI
jgi:predicted nucleic acid binding AN1-type Zn finger protein